MKYEVDRIDESIVTLDTYNSDLNLVIDGSKYSAHPLTQEGFAFMWAGARATHGSDKGKFCFEVKILEHLDVSHLPADEPNPHVVRVGFSVDSTSMQLGEEPLSYGYGGTGKISTNCQFRDFGPPFTAGDTIVAAANYDADPVQIGFAKNGNFAGWAYRINKRELQGKALFPHILTKNTSFEVNFGQRGEPYFKLPEALKDFTFIGNVPKDKRVAGTRAPEKREDCEMIMMCGLPGAGKSVWAADYSLKNPDKKYNILGTNNIIDKMKVMGLPRKRNYHGRWDVLIQMATKCLNTMFSIGSKLRRNYILDQTNVYPTAQRRKMRNFDGFKRLSVVVVPSDVEYKRRCDKRDREEGKEIPDSAVLEMKANFKIPEENDLFEKIIFTDLQREEAEKLVIQYNEEGKAATGPNKKQFRSNEPSGFGERKVRDDNRGPNMYGGNPGGYGGYGKDQESFGGYGGRGGYDSGGDMYGRGDGYSERGGFDSNRGSRGGYDRGRGSRGGYDGGRGRRGGYDNDYSGRGGYDSDRSGRGGYDNGGRGGYDSDRSGRGGYDNGGRGGYDSDRSGRGGYGSDRGGRGGYDSGRGGRGGYDSGRGGRGGRGGYDSGRGSRGGYDSGRGGRGGFDNGRGGYDSGRSGYGERDSFDSSRGGGFDNDRSSGYGGRGGFGSGRGGSDSERRGRGGYDNSRGGRGGSDRGRGGRGSRGGYDSGRGGRGGFDSRGRRDYDSGRGGYDRGGRDSYESGYTGGYGSSPVESRRDAYDSYDNSSSNPSGSNYSAYSKSGYDQGGDAYGSGGYSSQPSRSGYDSGNNERGYGRGGSSASSYQSGSRNSSGQSAQADYGSGSSFGKDSQNDYYSGSYSYDSTSGYSSYGSASDNYSAGTGGYTGAQTVKAEPADPYGGSNTNTSSSYSQEAGSGRVSGKPSRWGAQVQAPETAAPASAPSYPGTGASTYDYSAAGQAAAAMPVAPAYDYSQGMASAAQPWTANVGNQAGYPAAQAAAWSQYGQQAGAYPYYTQ